VWKTARLFVLYPLVAISFCYLLLTGSPIPLWHLEELRSPVAVCRATAEHLELADGRTIKLPYVRKIPFRNPLFQTALEHGVEINDDGEVFALMWQDPICGNDPVVWKRFRINLTDLAAALDANGLDDELVSTETIEYISEHKQIETTSPRSHAKGHLSGWDRLSMTSIRSAIGASTETER